MEDGAGDQCEYLPWRSKRKGKKKLVLSFYSMGKLRPTEGNQLGLIVKEQVGDKSEAILSHPSLVTQ